MRKYDTVPLYGDKSFSPIELFLARYERDAERAASARPLWLGLERENGLVSTMRLSIIQDDDRTYRYVERLAKSLLWLRGGYRLFVAGDEGIADALSRDYSESGPRAFDAKMMETVYGAAFEVRGVSFGAFPEQKESTTEIGGRWDGCRIGFDAGGSDRKAAAVLDGDVIFSEEVVWKPKVNENPEYHYKEITEAFRLARAHLPRVDAIGVSSAGIFVGNRTKVASLFLKVPGEAFKEHIEDIYIRAAREVGCDRLVVANDGDVAALAGAYQTGEGRLLGIALGTSEAGGYVNAESRVMGWLNELAFAPVDMSEYAAADEWSGDIGCGVKYFSQDAVIRLASAVGIAFPMEHTPGERLKTIQQMLLTDEPLIGPIFETIGVYLAYTIKFYSRFYDLGTVMLMGRVMSGRGGELLLDKARRTLAELFPSLQVKLALPDERNRRLGQAIVAASLPVI